MREPEKLSYIINRLQTSCVELNIEREGGVSATTIRWHTNPNPVNARMGTMLRNAAARVEQCLGHTYTVDQDWQHKCLTVTNDAHLCRQVYWITESMQEKWGPRSLAELGVAADTVKSLTE